MSHTKRQFAVLVVALVALAVLILWFAWSTGKLGNSQPQHDLQAAGIVALKTPRALPDLSFQTSENTELRTQEMQNHWYLIYFGYTYCPDICPTSLAEMRQIHRLLTPEAQQQVRFTMLTVDPERDTAEQLRAYLNFFHPDFLALSVSMANIQSVIASLAIPVMPGDTEKAVYTFFHSGNLAIISPDGKHFGFVQAPFKIQSVAEQFNRLVQSTAP